MAKWIQCWILIGAVLSAADPPPGWIKKVALQEARSEEARNQYLYKQTFVFEEFNTKNLADGRYREEREIIFLADGRREEKLLKPADNSLRRIILTEEDFQDIRGIQPMVISPDILHLYDFKYKGEDQWEGIDCWMLQMRPHQMFPGQRYFDGILWVDQRDFSVIRLDGQAVPQIYSKSSSDHLFPKFTTIRRQVDGKHWFPVQTYADDSLPFKSGPIRVRFVIRYADYKKFGAEVKIIDE